MMKRMTGKDEIGYYMLRDITLNCLKIRGECVDRIGAYEDAERILPRMRVQDGWRC